MLGFHLFGRLLLGLSQNRAGSCSPKIMLWVRLCEYCHCGHFSWTLTKSERQGLWKTVWWNSFAKNQTYMRGKCTPLLVFVRLQPVKRNRHFQCTIQFLLKYVCKTDQMNCPLKYLNAFPSSHYKESLLTWRQISTLLTPKVREVQRYEIFKDAVKIRFS